MDNEWGYLIIKPNGEIKVVESDTYEFTLDELYGGANCDTIQILQCQSYDRNLLMCIDDNGKIFGKEHNIIASFLYAPFYDYIVGDAVIGTRFCIDPNAEPDIYKMPLRECVKLREKLLKAE